MNLLILIGFFTFIFGIFFFLFSIFLYYNLIFYILEWNMMIYNSMKFSAIIYIDFISMLFLSTVFLISFFVMIYSIDYMELDFNINRFFYLLILFILSMMMMVLSPSILSILLGWDGLGLVSFCLVIYYQNSMALNSGLLTVLCNRIGDLGLLMLIGFSSMNGSWNLMLYNLDYLMMFFILLAMITKSAQMPFSLWLPAAMMAPTPISSLVHSSTLVTAGVYLLIRYNLLMDNLFMQYVLYISIFTMFMAGLIANFEFDLKKNIALSTLSQLGFMFSILSLGMVELAFFHLIIHALFKSMMFMSAGMIIHNMGNNQDIRKYGKLLIYMPMSSLIMIVGSLSLCGFFFFSGFYSKDLIIEYFLIFKLNLFLMLMFYFSMIFTLSYSIRLLMWLFLNDNNFYMNYMFLSESFKMNFCLFILSFLTLFFGMKIYYYLYLNYFVLLSIWDKFLILKIIIFGFYFGMFFYYYNMKNYIIFMFFFKTMYFLENLFKIIYLDLLKFIFLYDMKLEKGILINMMALNIYFLMIDKKIMSFKYKSISIMNLLLLNLINLIIICCLWN